jgi:hypothetical protein
MDTENNSVEDNNSTIATKAGKVTKRLVNLSAAGLKKTKAMPGKAKSASKKGVASFKQGFNEA